MAKAVGESENYVVGLEAANESASVEVMSSTDADLTHTYFPGIPCQHNTTPQSDVIERTKAKTIGTLEAVSCRKSDKHRRLPWCAGG